MRISSFFNKLKYQIANDREFTLFLLAGLFIGLAGGIYNSIFPNYLHEVFGISEFQRGVLEIPREGAGLVVMFVVGVMSFLGDVRLSRVSLLLNAIGSLFIAILSPTYGSMILWLFVFSLGQHLLIPLTPKIIMDMSTSEHYGMRIARNSAYAQVATIVGCGIAMLWMLIYPVGFVPMFIIASVFFAVAVVAMFFMRADKPDHKRPQFIFRKKYMLFYGLCFANGARKQIFLTFAPWVLVSVFNVKTPAIALLGIVTGVVMVGTRTIVGRTIDSLGERKVLMAEAVLLVVICLGYGLSGKIFSAAVTLVIVAACYVIDSSMSVVEMARYTYMRKIAVMESDVTPTLSAGTSIDHIASMFIPTLGGALWAITGSYEPVFLAAASIAIINIILTSRIKIVKTSLSEA